MKGIWHAIIFSALEISCEPGNSIALTVREHTADSEHKSDFDGLQVGKACIMEQQLLNDGLFGE